MLSMQRDGEQKRDRDFSEKFTSKQYLAGSYLNELTADPTNTTRNFFQYALILIQARQVHTQT